MDRRNRGPSQGWTASGNSLSAADLSALLALGDAHLREGKLDHAQACYERAAAAAPSLVGAHYGLGNVAIQHGRMQLAVTHYRRVLALNPNFAEACSNIGVALVALNQPEAGAQYYQRAIALKPDLIDVYRNLIRVFLSQGQPHRALDVARRALAIRETDEIKILLLQCLKILPREAWTAEVPRWIARALSEGWTRPGELSGLAAELIKSNPLIGGCIMRAVAGWPARPSAKELWNQEEFAIVASDGLLRALLESAPVCDIALERFLTMARNAMLETIAALDRPPPLDVLGITCSLARQCFINEYAFVETAAETAAIAKLFTAIQEGSEASASASALHVAVLAAYRPLHSLPFSEKILSRHWPTPVAALIEQQVHEPRQEMSLRGTIPVLTSIDDPVSQKVRRQYEEMPYPRWLKPAPSGRPVSIDWYLRNQFRNAPIADPGRRGTLDILVAGCGTGQHAIETSRRFAGAVVTAVDLSLASLSYAKRKSTALGLTNVRYAQADILGLGALGQTFDLIEASGVLHHLGDWAAGWRILLSLLRPGGFMHVGLYSALARSDVRTARAFIAEQGYGNSLEEIRRCRADILTQEDRSPLKNVAKFTDFFTTSECRDLLFHVQEHQLTLPEIQSFLKANGLVFIGFASIDAREFRRRHPHDDALRDLDLWYSFETENPTTFVGMYQFWVQKA